MALHIIEYLRAGRDGRNDVAQVPELPVHAEQTVAIDGSSTASTNAVDEATAILVLHPSDACHVAFGPSPTATTSNQRLAADGRYTWAVPPGLRGTLKVAVIQA